MKTPDPSSAALKKANQILGFSVERTKQETLLRPDTRRTRTLNAVSSKPDSSKPKRCSQRKVWAVGQLLCYDFKID